MNDLHSSSPRPRPASATSAPASHAPTGQPAASTRTFTTQITIDAPCDIVWKALADAAEIERWFAPEASVEPRVGGRLLWRWREHHTWECTIDTWQPGERLRLRYDSAVDDGQGGKRPLFIDFVLQAREGRTTLRLVQSGFGPEADFDKEYDGISRGWPVELRSLEIYVERHRGRDRALTWFAHPTHLSPAATWARLTGQGGLEGATGIDALAEGAPFAVRTPEGDVFEGAALCCHEREFTGVVENLGGAWLRISVETFTGESVLWFWVATWGEDAAPLQQRQVRLRRFLERLFPAPQRGESL